MKLRGFLSVAVFFAVVFFAYGQAGAQVVDKIKDAAGKTKDVTVDTVKKVADKTEDAASATGKAVKSTSKTIGRHTVTVTENIAGEVSEGGRWLMVTTWDGTKWVSKRTWFATKKAAGAVKDAVN